MIRVRVEMSDGSIGNVYERTWLDEEDELAEPGCSSITCLMASVLETIVRDNDPGPGKLVRALGAFMQNFVSISALDLAGGDPVLAECLSLANRLASWTPKKEPDDDG